MLHQVLIVALLTLLYPIYCIADKVTQIIETTGTGDLGSEINKDGNKFYITGGTRSGDGSNLFHSFSVFNINASDTAVFDNSSQTYTENIISRVSGADPSIINGIIETNGFMDTNLFFINNNGVIFGESARLNIDGSFHVIAADYLELGSDNKSLFYANENFNSTLTSEPISAYGFLDQSGDIEVRSNEFVLDNTASLSLIALSIQLSNARIEAGKVNVFGQSLNMDGSSISTLGTAVSATTVDISVESADITNGSLIDAGTISNEAGGNIAIRANESINISGFKIDSGTVIPTKIRSSSTGFGNAGSITIESPVVMIVDRAQILANSFRGTSKSGDIKLNTNHLLIDSGANIRNSTKAGSGGIIKVRGEDGKTASNILELNGGHEAGTGIFSETQSNSQAGDIDLMANNIVLNNAQINADSISENENSGKSGNINIHTPESLSLTNGSSINVTTTQANAGTIQLATGRLLRLDKSSQITSSVGGGDGKGGDIGITSEFVVLDGGSEITATATNGPGGKIDINADYLFNSPDSLISAKSSGNIDGVVAVTAPDENIISSTLNLSDTYLNMPDLSANPCASRTDSNGNSLIIRETSGIAPEPDSMLSTSSSDQANQLPPVSLQTIGNTIVLAELECRTNHN